MGEQWKIRPPTPQVFDDKPLPLLANPLFFTCLAVGGLIHYIVYNTGTCTWRLRKIPLMAPHSII